MYELERCGPHELQSYKTYARLQAELAKQMSSAEEFADLQLLVGDARNAFEAERGAQDTPALCLETNALVCSDIEAVLIAFVWFDLVETLLTIDCGSADNHVVNRTNSNILAAQGHLHSFEGTGH